MIQELRVPRARVAVLLRHQQALEKATGTTLRVQKDGGVDVQGDVEHLLVAVNLVKAIGRGFSYPSALTLLEEDAQLAVIAVDGTEKTVRRLMSRVIGRRGLAKKNIERFSGAKLCVYGKTVAILGPPGSVHMAATAVDDLLGGRKHTFVWAKLEKMKRLADEEADQDDI
ncbi:MAG: RNA-processing protein [Candidatus Aenigmarchaeota archaeon]|nr:RNA-processing protein [Candidatus Aenigmarchaeota archaeon]